MLSGTSAATVIPLRRFCFAAVALIAALCSSCDLVRARIADYPGPQIRVVFAHDGVRLSGLLMLPRGAGPFPAVVFVHGSGAWVYKNNLAWQAHARAFHKRGFAVLVYDKRGAGGSSGRLANADYENLAGDVVAAVQLLRTRPDIRQNSIGLFGFSEGGWVSLLAAHMLQRTRNGASFLITSSGPAVTPARQTLYANTMELRKLGVPDSVIARANHVLQRVWDYYRLAAVDSLHAGGRRDSLQAEIAALAHLRGTEMPGQLGRYDRAHYGAIARRVFFEPVPLLETLPCPLLAVFGATDDVVNASESADILRSLRHAENRDITVRMFPGVGHSLVDKNRLIPHYASGYLAHITGWAQQHVARPGKSRTGHSVAPASGAYRR